MERRIFDATDARGEFRFGVRVKGDGLDEEFSYLLLKVIITPTEVKATTSYDNFLLKYKPLELDHDQMLSMWVDVYAATGEVVEVVEIGPLEVIRSTPNKYNGRVESTTYTLARIDMGE